jgi:hypothetical protein
MSIDPQLEQAAIPSQREAWQTPRLEILPITESENNGTLGNPINDGTNPCSS